MIQLDEGSGEHSPLGQELPTQCLLQFPHLGYRNRVGGGGRLVEHCGDGCGSPPSDGEIGHPLLSSGAYPVNQTMGKIPFEILL